MRSEQAGQGPLTCYKIQHPVIPLQGSEAAESASVSSSACGHANTCSNVREAVEEVTENAVDTWVSVPVLKLAGSVTLGRSLNLSVPHLWGRRAHFKVSLRGNTFKHLEQGLAVALLTITWHSWQCPDSHPASVGQSLPWVSRALPRRGSPSPRTCGCCPMLARASALILNLNSPH